MKNTFFQQFVFILFVAFLSSCGYNDIQEKEEAVFSAWSDIDTTLQRRADLIPNLVNTVKGYAAHEKDTLQAVINARAQASSVQINVDDLNNPALMSQFQQAQNNLSSSLSRLLLVVERYPDLKANESFLDLQNQLEGTENRITVARQRYNDAVKSFNSTIRKFPENLTNKYLLELEKKSYFEADEQARSAPTVQF